MCINAAFFIKEREGGPKSNHAHTFTQLLRQAKQ